ncbi:MAG TPA: DUF4293 domain-containing protein [Tenuifilaceae bacterium]|nr:DUF4293 domain-containing protein [Tenuifilaceae bacterium]
MIQRIQTVFLMIAFIILTFQFWFPFAEIVGTSEQHIFELGFSGLKNVNEGQKIAFESLPLSILMLACTAIPFITIFLYRKRMIQIRLSIINIVLLLGLQGVFYFYYSAALKALSGSGTMKIIFVFPLVAAILTFLALRAIARDEALVRSLDRLR